MVFRWNDWNRDHIAGHSVSPAEAEGVIRETRRPYPLYREDGKWLVWGAGRGGRLLQVVFVIDDDDSIYVIHARPLKNREKRRYRRRHQ